MSHTEALCESQCPQCSRRCEAVLNHKKLQPVHFHIQGLPNAHIWEGGEE